MSNLVLPKIDRSTIKKKEFILGKLKKFTNAENILSHQSEIKPYETDGLAAYKQTPLAVVLPENTEEVSKILKFCNDENIKIIPRGAGTGLSGGLFGLFKINKRVFSLIKDNIFSGLIEKSLFSSMLIGTAFAPV